MTISFFSEFTRGAGHSMLSVWTGSVVIPRASLHLHRLTRDHFSAIYMQRKYALESLLPFLSNTCMEHPLGSSHAEPLEASHCCFTGDLQGPSIISPYEGTHLDGAPLRDNREVPPGIHCYNQKVNWSPYRGGHTCVTTCNFDRRSVAEWILWLPHTQESRVLAPLKRNKNLCLLIVS